jgi:hypothetical protein
VVSELSSPMSKTMNRTELCNSMRITDWPTLKRRKTKIFPNQEVKELSYWQMEKIIWPNNHLCNTLMLLVILC